MVMFTCNRCSEGLKKNQVQNHSFKCGGPSKINVTCHDCLKDFRGSEFESHTSCVSEEVRYGGKGAVVKETAKKQNLWCEVVRDVLKNNKSLEQPVRKFLTSIVHMDNIPRKRPKFMNWAANANKCHDREFLDKVFNILESEFNSARATEQPSKKQNGSAGSEKSENPNEKKVTEEEPTNGETSPNANGTEPIKKKKKKSKREEPMEGVEDDSTKVENEELVEAKIADELIEKCEIQENGHESRKKKKKKKSAEVSVDAASLGEVVMEEANTEIAEDLNETCEISENDNTLKKKKKKKKADVTNEEATEGIVESPLDASGELTEVNEPSQAPGDNDAPQKLSKKERKLLKKKAKFEAEVAEIEHYKKEEDEEKVDQAAEEGKPKKGKKRKNDVAAGEPDSQRSESAKKQKVEAGDENQMEELTAEAEGESSPKKEKFQWHETILAVLKKSKNDEVPVKKVTKRVIDHYISLYGDKGIHEKLYSKMNKKLQTCPGIRVLKDKVKLIESNE